MRERRPLIRFKDFKLSDLEAIRAENKKGGVKKSAKTKPVDPAAPADLSVTSKQPTSFTDVLARLKRKN